MKHVYFTKKYLIKLKAILYKISSRTTLQFMKDVYFAKGV